MKASKIWIIDDEPIVLKALSRTIEQMGNVVRCFDRAEDCLNVLQPGCCDLVISDVNLPGLNGIELLEKVRMKMPLVPVVIISGVGDIPLAVRALKKGAVDFIEKPLSEDTLLPTITLALSRDNLGSNYDLTETEMVVLKHVALGKSSKEISQLLERSVRTVENHRHRIMKKVSVSNSTSLLNFAYSIGLGPAPLAARRRPSIEE